MAQDGIARPGKAREPHGAAAGRHPVERHPWPRREVAARTDAASRTSGPPPAGAAA